MSSNQLVPSERPVGKVTNAQRLSKGGALLIVPFSAGVNAAATKQLDAVALMIVKGIADALQQSHAPFDVLTNDNAGSADLILEGFIEEYIDPGKLKKWVPQKKEIKIAVKAKLFDSRTKEPAIFFYHTKTASLKNIKSLDLAYQLGEELGQYIAGEVSQEAGGSP